MQAGQKVRIKDTAVTSYGGMLVEVVKVNAVINVVYVRIRGRRSDFILPFAIDDVDPED